MARIRQSQQAVPVNPLAAYDSLGQAGGLDLRRLIAHSELTTIDFVKVSAERTWADRVHGGALAEPQEWVIDVSAPVVRCPAEPRAEGAAILVELGAVWRGGDGETYGHATVTLRVAYGFSGLAAAPSAAVVAQLGSDLGVHHAWPFLRERLRGISVELGLPAVVLPLRKR